LAYEIDKDLIPILKKNFSGNGNFILLNQDILDVKIDEDIQRFLPDSQNVVVVANLPYYITTPILMRFLETSKIVTKMVFMMQSEVADRVTSRPATKDYNALTVIINYRAETRILFPVPRSVFLPHPNVDSAVVEIRVRDQYPEKPADERRFFRFVHECFVQRRKTLVNNLRQALPNWPRFEIENLLAECGLDLNIRAEALEISDFIRLSDGVMKRG
jgi:16S rRNA (adenine1518-N6/adenine1519-N6)-dimethyltransferase